MDSAKATGLFRLRLNGVLQVFSGYGMNVYIPQVINEIVALAMELHDNLSTDNLPMDNLHADNLPMDNIPPNSTPSMGIDK